MVFTPGGVQFDGADDDGVERDTVGLVGFDDDDLFFLRDDAGVFEEVPVFAGVVFREDDVDFVSDAQHHPEIHVGLPEGRLPW